MIRAVSILFLILWCTGCGSAEELPPQRASNAFTMDGSRFVPINGSVNQVSQTDALNRSLSPDGWSTAPVPLRPPLGFAVGTRTGRVVIYDEFDSVKSIISLGDSLLIDQLAADGNALYAVTLTGDVFGIDALTGKPLWRQSVGNSVTANVILNDRFLLVPTGQKVMKIDRQDRSVTELVVSTLTVHTQSLVNDNLYVAVTRNQSGGDDSLYVISVNTNERRFQYGFRETRFTSNLSVCGPDKDHLVVGFLGGFAAGHREAGIMLLEGISSGKPTIKWRHKLPYLVANVAGYETAAFASGIRAQSGEMISGLDAFSLEDTSILWSRRFTEPLIAPVAVGNGNLYFFLSFEAEALTDTRTIFYTLNSETGKTLREQGLKGAMNGLLPQMPMPDQRGRFLVADRENLIVYILDRSSYERVFK